MQGQSAASDRPRILVVERETDVALALRQQLQQMRYEVCGCVDNGPAAIACADESRPDLLLTNVVLNGEMDGISTAEQIRRVRQIPVLFLTAFSDAGTVERSLRAHPSAYLTKPFDARELRAQIEVALFQGRLQQRLRESERWLHATLRCVGDGVVATDAQGRVRFLNPAAERLLGWRLSEAIGNDVDSIVRLADDDGACVQPSPLRRALALDAVVSLERPSLLIERHGARLLIDDTAAPIHGDQDRLLGAVLVFHDARQRVHAEQSLQQSEQRFRNAFNLAPAGMAMVDIEGRFQRVNTALCRLLGHSETFLLGRTEVEFGFEEESAMQAPLLRRLRSGDATSVQFEKRYRRDGVGPVWTLVSVSLLNQGVLPQCFLFQIQNISERKQSEETLARLAHYDPLTGLANRVTLSEEIARQIASARRHGSRFAVVFLDIDNFKQVNDSLGHEAGDLLLQMIADRLRQAVRASDTVGRLGGDEFVILLPEIAHLGDIVVVTEKVQAECAGPLHIGGQDIRIGISLGVSLFPDDADDPRTLLRYADSAMYQAKSQGRNNLQFYRPELTRHLERRMRLGADLRSALERDEFELYFQPIVGLADGRPRSAEALLRWNHPTLGQLSPDAFMPLAEETGLSSRIGRWVLAQACREAMQWRKGAPVTLAVNVSPSQFREGNLPALVEQALAESGLPPQRLCIEITEQLLLEDTEDNRAALARLQGAGVLVAIDDFGTGYSSLSYISRFHPGELKLDRSLIEHILDGPDHAAIATAAIAMARSLSLEIVPEGIETPAQKDYLKELGCTVGQGFLFMRPCGAAAFRHWLAQQHAEADDVDDRETQAAKAPGRSPAPNPHPKDHDHET